MSVANEIAAKLVALGIGTLGTDLFIGFMPASPNACCPVIESGGQAPEMQFGSTAIGYEEPALQLLFRGAKNDYAGPRAKAETAYQGLATVQAVTLSVSGGTSAFYHYVAPRQAPFLLERDALERVVIAFNVLARKDPSA